MSWKISGMNQSLAILFIAEVAKGRFVQRPVVSNPDSLMSYIKYHKLLIVVINFNSYVDKYLPDLLIIFVSNIFVYLELLIILYCFVSNYLVVSDLEM